MKPLTLWLLFSSAIGPLVQADRPAILFDLTPFDEHKVPPYPGFTVESWADCDRPWILCRCPEAEADMIRIATNFGRLPPGLRVGVSHMMAVSSKRETGNVELPMGINEGGRNVFLKGLIDGSIVSHEAFHSFDRGFSDSKTFTDAYNADTCVATNYANKNVQERFADLGTWVHYDMNGEPVEDWLDKDIGCTKNQLAAVKEYAQDALDFRTTQCGPRGPDDKFLDPSNRGKGPTNLTVFRGSRENMPLLAERPMAK
ncbi:hypothetical protein K491DRAFT_756101 [Lophiostoma macrostomum CBS 122681]|uniref:Uncharacterized protein n=1 Tax=Lophiostoma macrostomum CBS 122681 TaxID=1314788 RepID=A0A6A6THG7_9PLEO|nr:hypothetical protein K491DRAFT_756101 [Lophiostoma macrostomum CBS 122681]